jgi:hypothetical protein
MIKAKFNLLSLAAGLFLILQFIGFLTILSFPLSVSAQANVTNSLNFKPQVQIPLSEFRETVPVGRYNVASGTMTSDLLPRYIMAFYNYGLAIAGILATIVLMGGGVIWLISGGDSGKIGQAKELIAGSITGIIILVVAWVILNTINPELVNLKAIETIVIKKVSYCCDPAKGHVPMNKDGKCDTGAVCDTSGGARCINTGNNVFGCIKVNMTLNSDGEILNSTTAENRENKYFCCEYTFGTKKYCETVTAGNSCPATHAFYGGNGGLTVSHNSWCATRETSAKNCLVDECAGAEEGASCGNDGYCYSEICWTGDGKEGEPCGNDGGSKCLKDGAKCDNHDYNGGRDCGDDMFCCYKVTE